MKPLVGCVTTSLCTGKCENLLSKAVFIVNIVFIVLDFFCAHGSVKRASSCKSQLLLGYFAQKHCVQFPDCCLCYITVNTLYMKRC